jgi:hypothetical protein
MSSRKSVSAVACNSSIRACACANCALRRRIVDLASLEAAGGRGEATDGARSSAVFWAAALLFGPFTAPEAGALVLFFMRILVEACL